jgi:hypothetical protein
MSAQTSDITRYCSPVRWVHRVIAIEPVPGTVALLHDSIVGNGFSDRTRLIDGAAGAVPSSKVHMLVPQGEPKNAAVAAAAQEGSILGPVYIHYWVQRTMPTRLIIAAKQASVFS